MNKEDMKWLIQMMLIIAVPILVEYIKQKRALQTSPSRQMIQTIKELRCKRANALLATSLYHMEVVK